eukprot:gene11852-13995_t
MSLLCVLAEATRGGIDLKGLALGIKAEAAAKKQKAADPYENTCVLDDLISSKRQKQSATVEKKQAAAAEREAAKSQGGMKGAQ